VSLAGESLTNETLSIRPIRPIRPISSWNLPKVPTLKQKIAGTA